MEMEVEATTRKGWGPERDGKYQYRSPTRLWEFEPHRDHGAPRLSSSSVRNLDANPGKWRYEHRTLWLDWKPGNGRTRILLRNEEIPPVQYQTMREIQRYNNRRKEELEEEEFQRCRQARLDLEKEAKEERERGSGKAGANHQVEKIDQVAPDMALEEKAKGLKRLISKMLQHVRSFFKKAKSANSSGSRGVIPMDIRDFVVAPEDEPLLLRSEEFRKRLSLMELEIEDDCQRKANELDYWLWRSIPADMRTRAPEV